MPANGSSSSHSLRPADAEPAAARQRALRLPVARATARRASQPLEPRRISGGGTPLQRAATAVMGWSPSS